MMYRAIVAVIALSVSIASVSAQGRGRGRGTATAAKEVSARVIVRDQAGAPLDAVRLTLSGATSGEFSTGAAGSAIIPNLKPGTYRLRCERDGYVTLEREFIVGTALMTPVDIVLSEAPPPPKPPEPPAPAPSASGPSGPPVTVSVPDFLDKNFIGRDQIKESILACNPNETVRLLQLREGLAGHAHDTMDEIVYVVAGEGAIKIGDDTTAVRAGALSVVPRGATHAFERRGRNPLILLSTLTGAPCTAGSGGK
jgi:quercetin dioxygenase-like cupin family protein